MSFRSGKTWTVTLVILPRNVKWIIIIFYKEFCINTWLAYLTFNEDNNFSTRISRTSWYKYTDNIVARSIVGMSDSVVISNHCTWGIIVVSKWKLIEVSWQFIVILKITTLPHNWLMYTKYYSQIACPTNLTCMSVTGGCYNIPYKKSFRKYASYESTKTSVRKNL